MRRSLVIAASLVLAGATWASGPAPVSPMPTATAVPTAAPTASPQIDRAAV